MAAQIKLVSVDELTFSKFNPKSRTEERRLKYLKHSMEEHGFVDAFPIIANEDGVVADGHRRLTVARLLGIDKVPVMYVNGGITVEQYWSFNAISESPTATEVLDAYTNGMNVLPDKHRNTIILLQATLGGKRQLKELFKKGSFSPAIYHYSKHIANYCNRGDDVSFVVQAINWLVEKKMQRNARLAIESNVDPEVLISAIEESRPLSIVANIQ